MVCENVRVGSGSTRAGGEAPDTHVVVVVQVGAAGFVRVVLVEARTRLVAVGQIHRRIAQLRDRRAAVALFVPDPYRSLMSSGLTSGEDAPMKGAPSAWQAVWHMECRMESSLRNTGTAPGTNCRQSSVAELLTQA